MTDNRVIYRTAFIKKLEQLGIIYRVADKAVICFDWAGSAPEHISYELRLTESRATLTAVDLGSFTASTLATGYQLCSILNSELQWVKFVIDRHNRLLCLIDTVLNPDDAVEEIMELLERLDRAVTENKLLLQAAQRQRAC